MDDILANTFDDGSRIKKKSRAIGELKQLLECLRNNLWIGNMELKYFKEYQGIEHSYYFMPNSLCSSLQLSFRVCEN